MSPANFHAWDDAEILEELAGFSRQSYNVSGDQNAAEHVSGAQVTGNFFRTLGVTPSLGRDFTAADDLYGAEPVVILSHALWRRRFGGDSKVLGQTLSIDARPHTVIGVMPIEFDTYAADKEDLWLPGLLSIAAAHDTAQAYRWHWIRGIGRLSTAVDLSEAQLRLNQIASRLEIEFPESNRAGE